MIHHLDVISLIKKIPWIATYRQKKMSTSQQDTNKPVEIKSFNPAIPSSGTRWVDERLNHERQLRLYKRIAFWLSCSVCISLYITFFIILFLLFKSTLVLQIVIAHKHLMTVLMALLLIPSAILWGMVRAVFKVSSTSNGSDVVKALSSVHPGTSPF